MTVTRKILFALVFAAFSSAALAVSRYMYRIGYEDGFLECGNLDWE
jgi:hypothetical protein